MIRSEMEMIYVCKGPNAYKTGIGAIFDTNAATFDAFKSAKKIGVPLQDAEFLLDYYNRRGELSDTVGLSRSGFEYITGEKAKSESEYAEVDREHWAKLATGADA